MSHALIPTATVRWALLEGQFPDDIARMAKDSLRIFQIEPDLYDSPGLHGPAKCAELVVKLAYWLAEGRLTPAEFREWAAKIPPDDNAGWDVDLCAHPHGSLLTQVLKMGLFVPLAAAGAGV